MSLDVGGQKRHGDRRTMNIRSIILSSILLLTLPIFAQESQDVIVMKNGDRFTCEIKGLSGGVLSVKLTYVDGTIAVQWSQIEHLESSRLFLVQTEGGAVYTGKLSTSGESNDPGRCDAGTGNRGSTSPDHQPHPNLRRILAVIETSWYNRVVWKILTNHLDESSFLLSKIF